MRQVMLRVSDDLADGLKRAARDRSRSVNSYAAEILAAAVDPDLAGEEVTRIRERLSRAGLLEPRIKPPENGPDPAVVARAKRRAGRGQPLAEIVAEGRR